MTRPGPAADKKSAAQKTRRFDWKNPLALDYLQTQRVGREGSKPTARRWSTSQQAARFRTEIGNLFVACQQWFPTRLRDVHRGDEQAMDKYVIKLYITGQTPRSQRAIDNLRRICEEELCGQYDLVVIDVLERPQLAEDEKILATPTVVKELPPPIRRIIGDLSDADRVLLGLDLHARKGPVPASRMD